MKTTEIKPSTAPELSYPELLELHEKITQELPHWRAVLRDASSNVKGLENQKQAAEAMQKEPTATLRQKNEATETLDRISWRLKREQQRVSVAEGQIKHWEKREKDFPKERFEKLH